MKFIKKDQYIINIKKLESIVGHEKFGNVEINMIEINFDFESMNLCLCDNECYKFCMRIIQDFLKSKDSTFFIEGKIKIENVLDLDELVRICKYTLEDDELEKFGILFDAERAKAKQMSELSGE